MATRFRVTKDGTISGQGMSFRCAIGRGGMRDAARKTERDGTTPVGTWTLKTVFWRADRIDRPVTPLKTVPLHPDDGWCDEPGDVLYNCPVKRPYPASNEQMWREDDAYNVVVELDHNSDPVKPNAGSAIFIHIAKPDYSATEGCVALKLEDLLQVLEKCGKDTQIEFSDQVA